ncbi:hypothetical protein Nepgr_018673 [Nepenthes gracilis]|uniref:Uncharacterized protein n=1 Tax=Nepenthes gracilis TaxID=150966 RepID=A0AAD3SUK9_NEPGR|nr:hypothetical protein Nepgr_018673 [Nepenthes gracilis]
MHHGLRRTEKHKSSRRNSAAHQVAKNSSLDVDAADCGYPSSANLMVSKAIKQVPLASNQLSPKEKIDSGVFPLPTSGLPDGLKDHSLNLGVLHQAGVCDAPAKNSPSGLYHKKPNGCSLVCNSIQSCSSLEAEGPKPEQKIFSLALESSDNEVEASALQDQFLVEVEGGHVELSAPASVYSGVVEELTPPALSRRAEGPRLLRMNASVDFVAGTVFRGSICFFAGLPVAKSFVMWLRLHWWLLATCGSRLWSFYRMLLRCKGAADPGATEGLRCSAAIGC